MGRGSVKVRGGNSGEVALPDELHRELGIRQGQEAWFDIVLRGDGVIELVPRTDEVDTSARSEGWHQAQRRAQRELADGQGTVHEDGEALMKHLKNATGE